MFPVWFSRWTRTPGHFAKGSRYVPTRRKLMTF